jgi:uncharacterized protein (DUF433 family)
MGCVVAITGLERGSDLGQGLFSLADLRAYLALSGSGGDSEKALQWLTEVLNPVDHRAKRPDYSFADLISLFVVRELLQKGLRPKTVRDAEAYLRRKWKTARPFVTDGLKTDGCGIYVDDELVAGGQLESADRNGQQVIRETVKERLERVGYDEGLAVWWSPVHHVVVDPRIQFGEPVIKGTRIPTESVMEMAEWATVKQISKEMGISSEQTEAALEFENRRLTAARG